MTLVITQEMLDKLSHEIQEIRIRTLHDIENKVKRSFWERLDLKFKPTSLVKHLIRWFGNVPIKEETAVLELLSLLLKSKHGFNIVNHFSSTRLVKELGKIKYLIGSNPALAELVDNVIQQVHNVTESDSIRIDPESITESLTSLKIDYVDLTDSPRVSTGSNQMHVERSPNYYTKCWEVPLHSDSNTLKELNASLHPEGDEKDIHHAYSYLVPSINDYPPEFFLQPPYIFHSLIKLLEARKASIQTTIEMFHRLTVSIQKRLKSLQLTSMNIFQNPKYQSCQGENVQISVPAFVYEIFLLGIVCLKEVFNDPDLQDSNKIFNLFHELIELGSYQSLEEYQFREIRHELGYLAKHFRQHWEANSKCFATRTKYLVTINIMSTFLQHFNQTENAESTIANDTCFPHKPHYDPAEFETMNSTNHQRLLEANDQSWLHELQIAALDYPMKHIYPSVYEPVLHQVLKMNNRKLQILLSADEIFTPAVSILRQPAALSDEQLILVGLEAIDTLYLHRSVELVKLIIKAVGNCHCYFEGNAKLREAAEKLVLRLLSHADQLVKSTAYDQCNSVIKDFISSLDEGAILTHRRSFPKMEGKLQSLGIPLTVEILVEVICFGYCSSNKKIQQQAETILLFVLNSRTFLLDRWTDLLDIILPTLPLLQTVAIIKKHSTLSRAIVALLHPDSELPVVDLIRGNLRFLFQDDSDLREEALTRVLFLISSINNNQHYSPNIDHIRDTISNAICLVKSKYDVAKHLSSDVYELSAIKPLLDTLEQNNCDPAIRRSALIQLNLMAEDPCLCEIIHKANGWAFVLQALDNALREEHFLDYPDSAVPAIGILTKLCFSIPEFSRFFADNINVFNLVIRALLMHHHLPVFKPDCCSLLFLLLFSGYTSGCGKAVSLPVICNNYSIPFVCEFHWKCSPFNEMSFLEEMFAERNDGAEKMEIPGIGTETDNSILKSNRSCGIECATSWNKNNGVVVNESLNSPHENFESLQNYRQVAWRYLRLAFACQWFDAFENILVNAKKCRQSSRADKEQVIDYSILPPHLMATKQNGEGEVIDLVDNSLDFNHSLKLTHTDINMIKTSHVDEIFRNSLKNIAAASSHAEVSVGLSGLESNLILPMQEQIMHNSIVKHLKKFILTAPNTPADEKLLVDVIGLLGDLIQIGYENVLVWIVTLLFEQTSIFIQLLKSDTCSGDLFMKNADFIKITLQEALSCDNPNVTCLLVNDETYQIKIKREHNFNLLNKLFEIIINRLDVDLQKCDLMRILSLVGLARVVIHSGLVDFDNKFLNHVVNKLCSYINLIRSITYSGSTITKNCLLIMSFMLDQMKETHLKSKHYKVIALQCSHTSALIRSCAWNVLAKMAKSLSGAHSIIKECGYLPGGIHACCTTTILDPEEASIVKESATGLLVNLLSHRTEKGGPLHKFMLPYDKGSHSQLDGDPLETVLAIMKKHRFFELALESLQNFTTRDDKTVDEYNGVQMITCDVVKSYSMVFSCLLELKPELMEFLVEKCCLQRLMNCVSNVPLHPSRSALRMVSEICNLFLRCLKINKDEICELIAPYQAVIGGIIYLLNASLYSECDEDVFCEVTSNIMNLLNVLSMHKIGNQLIRCVLSELRLEPLVRLIVQGVSRNIRKDYQITCLRFLTVLVLESGVNTVSISEFTSFLGLLETVQLDSNEDTEPIRPASGEALCIKSLERHDNGFSSDDDQENHDPNSGKYIRPASRKSRIGTYTTGAERIFASLIEQFQIVCAKDKPENGALISTLQKRTLYSAIQVMLRQSEKARQVARRTKFLDILIDRLECIYSGVGLSYQDFVRKNGDSKKAPIVEEFSSIAGMLSSWFQNDILVHQSNITRICKMFLQLWPWISNNRDMENEFMKALVGLTEKSLIVCRSLPITYPGHPHSILKLTIAIATAETGKVKGPKYELTLLSLCLRILINCSSCQEGRTMIAKFNVLDNISKLHPIVTKLQKPWITVTKLWLEFWETYTRHNDVTTVKNLTVLGALIRKSTPELRRLSLEIMRNMSFVAVNRPVLLASSDYMYALKTVLDGTETTEQLIVICSIWKVIANNHKGKSAIKSSPIPRRLNALLKQRSLLQRCEDDDLYNILSVVVKLLQA
ncbi:protein rotatin homolog [Topomyia yanbarensis]|uniref:protein rotatin homolog n=1 Tax=Topomyia yanbarensis TaxID=2498891 RepID=UPI00273AA72D|nr:protein rotatin homolog [Topomyia yanbarensis]